MKSACNKHCQSGREHERVSDRRRREVRTCKQMGDKVSASCRDMKTGMLKDICNKYCKSVRELVVSD